MMHKEGEERERGKKHRSSTCPCRHKENKKEQKNGAGEACGRVRCLRGCLFPLFSVVGERFADWTPHASLPGTGVLCNTEIFALFFFSNMPHVWTQRPSLFCLSGRHQACLQESRHESILSPSSAFHQVQPAHRPYGI